MPRTKPEYNFSKRAYTPTERQMEALRKEVAQVSREDGRAGRSIKPQRSPNLAGAFTGLGTSFNPSIQPTTLSSQVRKNQLKRKAHLKAQALARHDEDQAKELLRQQKEEAKRKLREAEESETTQVWTEPDGSKTKMIFDGEGNLIGRESLDLKNKKESKAVDFGDDGNLVEMERVRDERLGNMTKEEYKALWETDPRSQAIIKAGMDKLKGVRE